MHNDSSNITNEELHVRASAGLKWLLRSIHATGMKGSSHIYSRWRYPLTGWHLGYPETSGYIIETLLNYAPIFPELPLKEYAHSTAGWLLTKQLPDGSFPALLGLESKPSFFNSGMIVFGLLPFQNDKILSRSIIAALESLSRWLMTLNTKTIKKEASYCSRAIWAYFLLAETLQDQRLIERLNEWMGVMKDRIQSNGAVQHWGFDSSNKAFTHTIAYTWRGFVEWGDVMRDSSFLDASKLFLDQLISEKSKHGELAGMYDTNWKGDYTFQCITGVAQLSILSQRVGTLMGVPEYNSLARHLLEDILSCQILRSLDPNLHGAIPGSKPIWGPYMRMKYPNWAVKFYLDALYVQIGSKRKDETS